MTDTWLRTKDGWRLLATTQVLAVLVDPPSVALPRATPGSDAEGGGAGRDRREGHDIVWKKLR